MKEIRVIDLSAGQIKNDVEVEVEVEASKKSTITEATRTVSARKISVGEEANIISKRSTVEVSNQVTPRIKFEFAKSIIRYIGFFIAGSAIVWIWLASEEAKAVFDIGVDKLVPIALIILGYYFGKSEN